ncbi:MAG: DoxX family protein [Phycisphaerales bacterium]
MSQVPTPAPTKANPSCATPCCSAPLRSTLGLVLRVALGSLFIFSGLMKLGIVDLSKINSALQVMEPRDFGASIKAFKLGLSDDLMSLLAYTIPWAEFLAGLCLLLGIMARGAALIIALMMLSFIGGIISLQVRGLDVKCTCFGALKLFCGDQPLGLCHLIRNGVFLVMALAVMATGPGALALCDPLRRKA